MLASPRRSLTPAAVFCAALILAAGALAAPPSLQASRVPTPPRIDGRLSDACWQQVPPVADFKLLKSGESPTQATAARVAFTDDALFFAFDCREDRPAQIQTKISRPDGGVYHDDCVEVFLAPFPDRSRYYHLIVNAAGVLQDELRQDISWQSKAGAAARKTDTGYTVELAVPLARLELDADVTPTWGLNLCREERPHGEISSWAPMASGFHDPDRFGTLSGLDLDLAPHVRRTLASRAELNAERADCLFHSLSDYRFSLGRRTAARTRRCWKALTAIGEQLRGAAAMPRLREIQTELNRLVADLDRLHSLAGKVELAAAMHKAGRPTSYAVCSVSTMSKRGPNSSLGHPVTKAVSLSAARNEYEPLQLLVVPLEKDLHQVKVRASGLKSGPHSIPAENVTVNVVGFVNIKQPSGRSGAPPGLYADPLLDNHPVDIEASGCRPFWITYYVPPNTPAGTYEGAITVAPAGEQPATYPVLLRVFDFELPRASFLRTSFGLSEGSILSRYGLPPAPNIPSGYHFGSWTGADIRGIANYFGSGVFEGALDTRVKHTGRRSIRIDCERAEKGTHEAPRACYYHDPPLKLAPKHKYSVKFFYRTTGVPDNGAYCSALGGAGGGVGLKASDQWTEAHFTMTTGDEGTARLYFGLRRPGQVWFDDVTIESEDRPGENLCPNPGFEAGDFALRRKILRAYRLNLLRHRASPTNIVSPRITVADDGKVTMDWTEFDEEISFLLDHGLTAFNMPWCRVARGWGKVTLTEDPKQLKQQEEILRQTEAHMVAKGWDRIGYLYIVDEPGKQYFPELKQAFGLIHKVAPRLKILLTFGYGATRPHEPGKPQYADLAGFVDIWVPHSDCFDREFLDTRRRAGDEIWDYVCISAQKPYANIWGIDYPGTDHRIVFWQCFAENMTGFLYWQTTYWKENPWENPLTYPGGNGDGSMFYPRKELAEGRYGPINSIRWELCRDGIEDFDYFRLLEQLVQRCEKLGKRKLAREGRKLLDLSPLTKSFTEYTDQPNALENRRLRIGSFLSRNADLLTQAAQ